MVKRHPNRRRNATRSKSADTRRKSKPSKSAHKKGSRSKSKSKARKRGEGSRDRHRSTRKSGAKRVASKRRAVVSRRPDGNVYPHKDKWSSGLRSYTEPLPKRGIRMVLVIVRLVFKYPGKRPKVWIAAYRAGSMGYARASLIDLEMARHYVARYGNAVDAAAVHDLIGVVALKPVAQRRGRKIGG